MSHGRLRYVPVKLTPFPT